MTMEASIPGAAGEAGITGLAALVNTHTRTWQAAPLGERSAEAIRAGHQAVGDIDELTRKLYRLRGQLVSELRQDSDLRGARVDAMLAGRRDQRAAALAIRMSRKDGAR